MSNFLYHRRHIRTVSKSTRPKIFGISTSSMFSSINRNSHISCTTGTCSLLATFGFLKMLSFSKVRMSFFFPLFLTSFQTSVGGSGERELSAHLSEVHTVESVSGFWCPLFQEFPGIVLDCSQLSQRGVLGRLAVFQFTILLILAFAFALGEWRPIVPYVVMLSHSYFSASANTGIAPSPTAPNI